MKPWIRALVSGWKEFWFAPARPTNLAVGRALFFAGILYFAMRVHFADWASVSNAFWMPIPLFRLTGLQPLPAVQLAALEFVWKTALLLSCVGLFTRASTLVSFVLGLYFFGLPHNFGKIHHNDTLVVLIMGILALSRAGDAFSLDALRAAWRRVPAAISPGPESPSPPREELAEYRWPVRLIAVLMTLVFFGAGFSKLSNSGLAWITSDNMASTLIAHHYSHYPPTDWGLHLAQWKVPCRALAAATILFELGAPVALLGRRAAFVIFGSLLCMQIGIWALLGLGFFNYFVCYLFLVPWDRLGRRLARVLDSGRGIRAPVEVGS
jgi:hypothetical protein